MAGPFQGAGHEFLVLLARTGAFAAEDFGVRRHEAPQKLRVFVIHVADFILAQETIFWLVGLNGHLELELERDVFNADFFLLR